MSQFADLFSRGLESGGNMAATGYQFALAQERQRLAERELQQRLEAEQADQQLRQRYAAMAEGNYAENQQRWGNEQQDRARDMGQQQAEQRWNTQQYAQYAPPVGVMNPADAMNPMAGFGNQVADTAGFAGMGLRAQQGALQRRMAQQQQLADQRIKQQRAMVLEKAIAASEAKLKDYGWNEKDPAVRQIMPQYRAMVSEHAHLTMGVDPRTTMTAYAQGDRMQSGGTTARPFNDTTTGMNKIADIVRRMSLLRSKMELPDASGFVGLGKFDPSTEQEVRVPKQYAEQELASLQDQLQYIASSLGMSVEQLVHERGGMVEPATAPTGGGMQDEEAAQLQVFNELTR